MCLDPAEVQVPPLPPSSSVLSNKGGWSGSAVFSSTAASSSEVATINFPQFNTQRWVPGVVVENNVISLRVFYVLTVDVTISIDINHTPSKRVPSPMFDVQM